MQLSPKARRFPKGFLWGTATSAHQIEGDNIHSDWWEREQNGKVGVKSGRACNSWNLWRQDINLAKSLHTNAYRFSLEWARIEPHDGEFNLTALRRYEQEIKYLHELGTQVMLTLWHFTLPQWFAAKGGFAKKENIIYFTRFISYVVNHLVTPPDYWITLNEPSNIYVSCAYLIGIWPPGERNLVKALQVFSNLISAHRSAHKVIHDKYPEAQVGAALHFMCVESFTKNPLLQLISWLVDLIVNRIFLFFIKNSLDYLGVNYYAATWVRWGHLFPQVKTASDLIPIYYGTDHDLWRDYPQGLYKILISLKKYHLPIIITENGVADSQDRIRARYIKDHLEWAWQAIRDGVDLRGYFHWTLMDNFEWSLGFKPKFGLFSTDFRTFKRTPRPSAAAYARICRLNAISTK
jgi:beta-glucosidase